MTMLSPYKQVRNVFMRPRIRIFCGLWKNDPWLPVWRRGPVLRFYKHRDVAWTPGDSNSGKKCYTLRTSITIKENDVYRMHQHKLPGNLKAWQVVWSSPIRRWLRQHHLGWLPTSITLPIWMRISVFRFILGWKVKWNDYVYEWPPQITFVFLGISLTMTLHAPCGHDEDYWEAILYYLDTQNITKTDEMLGGMTDMHTNETRRRLLPEMLKEPYKHELTKI